jgi:hypothetical protein
MIEQDKLKKFLFSMNEVAKEEPEDYEAEPEEAEDEKVPSEKQLIDWFRKHPYPEDEDLHKWVEKNGWNIHEVEDMVYKLATDHVKEMDKNAEEE